MDFLSKTLGSLSFNLSAFQIEEKVPEDPSFPSIWTVSHGYVKKDKRPCTLFQFDGSQLESTRRKPLADNMLQTLKKVRLPGLLKLIEFEQSGSTLVIATERVTPLSQRLPELSGIARLWGLQTLLTTLANLHTHIKLVHGNINIGSIYETSTGEWVLGGFEIATFLADTESMLSYGSLLPGADASAEWVPPEIKKNGWASVTRTPETIDTYEFGQLIVALQKGSPSKLPADVQRLAQLMIASKRPKIDAVATKASVFDTPLTKISESVSALMMLNDFDYVNLLTSIDKVAAEIPPAFLGAKLFPEFAKATTSSKGGIEAIRILIHLSTLIKGPNFEAHVLPYILHLYGLMDRAIRLELLKALPEYIDSMPNKVVQSKLLDALAPGLSDTEPLVRQESLRAVVHVAPKLSDRQLNGDLLRLLARTNNDKDPSVRAQTVLLLSELTELLAPSKRSSVVVTALSRALKDPATIVRSAALQALVNTSQYFSPKESAEKLVGPAALAALDGDWEVRAQAKKTVQDMFNTIMRESEKLDQSLENGKPPETRETETREQTPLSLFSSRVSVGTNQGANTSFADTSMSALTESAETSEIPAMKPQPVSTGGGIVQESADFRFDDELDGAGDAGDDGWGSWGDDPDDFDNLDTGMPAKVAKPAPEAKSTTIKSTTKGSNLEPEDDGDDDDGWGEDW